MVIRKKSSNRTASKNKVASKTPKRAIASGHSKTAAKPAKRGMVASGRGTTSKTAKKTNSNSKSTLGSEFYKSLGSSKKHDSFW